MSHKRVIPRDCFNEAKLLKCIGHLYIVGERSKNYGIEIDIEHNGQPFEVELTKDGSLWLKNVFVFINRSMVLMKTTYNSKANYPLFCAVSHEDEVQELRVFDEDGQLSEEFLKFFN